MVSAVSFLRVLLLRISFYTTERYLISILENIAHITGVYRIVLSWQVPWCNHITKLYYGAHSFLQFPLMLSFLTGEELFIISHFETRWYILSRPVLSVCYCLYEYNVFTDVHTTQHSSLNISLPGNRILVDLYQEERVVVMPCTLHYFRVFLPGVHTSSINFPGCFELAAGVYNCGFS
jgi:hypothetical protein